MKGRAILWSAVELAWLNENCAMPRPALRAAFCARFDRPEITVDQIKALCTRKGWKTGRDGRFAAGGVPANKGRKMPYNANSAATRFKKGNRTGRANQVYKPIGTERLSKEGYLERKVNDDMPFQRRWRAVQLIRWEELHGPIPKSMALKCLDGDKRNTDPANWTLIPRAILPRLNGGRSGRYLAFDSAEPEVKPVLLNIARIDHRARQMKEKQ